MRSPAFMGDVTPAGGPGGLPGILGELRAAGEKLKRVTKNFSDIIITVVTDDQSHETKSTMEGLLSRGGGHNCL